MVLFDIKEVKPEPLDDETNKVFTILASSDA